MHTQESGKGMKKLRNNKIRKLLAFMVALALMVSCMPSAYTISASEAFGDGTEDIFTDGEITSEPAAEESTPDVSSADQEETRIHPYLMIQFLRSFQQQLQTRAAA